MKTREVDEEMRSILSLISHPDFARFRSNLDSYEDFGDFGPRCIHPGTNLVGNTRLAADSIFARQYRSGLVLIGRVASPDMARGASAPMALSKSQTNTRAGVYGNFVGAAINNIAIYKLGLDKVHSDYGGLPMKVVPGSRLENGSEPLADAWKYNQALGEVAKNALSGRLADSPDPSTFGPILSETRPVLEVILRRGKKTDSGDKLRRSPVSVESCNSI
jgi:hypothetical protein